ncbi:MAG: hypothetical protein AAFU71_14805 [Cyanobacteria bacterium J06632_22]
MTSGNQNPKSSPTQSSRIQSSRFVRIRRPNTTQRHRPDPAISIDGERLRNVLDRLEGLSGE